MIGVVLTQTLYKVQDRRMLVADDVQHGQAVYGAAITGLAAALREQNGVAQLDIEAAEGGAGRGRFCVSKRGRFARDHFGGELYGVKIVKWLQIRLVFKKDERHTN